MIELPLVKGQFLLQKFQGKGGAYTAIPSVKQDKKIPLVG